MFFEVTDEYTVREGKALGIMKDLIFGRFAYPVQYGCAAVARTIPAPRPRYDNPTLCWLNPFVPPKMMGKTGNVRYTMPRTSAVQVSSARIMGSWISNSIRLAISFHWLKG